MSPRHKITWLALALVVAFIAVISAVSFYASRTPPQFITLPNGERYRFAGTTYGTNDVPPSFLARLVRHLPAPLAAIAKKYVGDRISQVNHGQFDSPQLSVWFQRVGTNAPPANLFTYFLAKLADQAGVEAGANGGTVFTPGIAWTFVSFPVVPRRSRILQCNIYSPISPGPQTGAVGQVSFPNPVYGRFPQWQPEPVPITKSNADLEIRLNEFVTGARQKQGFTDFDVSLNLPNDTNRFWLLHRIELSDATGNVFDQDPSGPVSSSFGNYIQYRPVQTNYHETINGTLWPDEAAWRLKLEFRASGIAPAELVTFKHVPIPGIKTTHTLNLAKNVGGIQVVLRDFVRESGTIQLSGVAQAGTASPYSQIGVELPNNPGGFALDLLDVTTDAGRPQRISGSGLERSHSLTLYSIPADATTMDLTFVLQKLRTVEFLVKPPQSLLSK